MPDSRQAGDPPSPHKYQHQPYYHPGPEFDLALAPQPWERLRVSIHLRRPLVNIDKCIGCGVCEHARLVKGRCTIRVTAENE